MCKYENCGVCQYCRDKKEIINSYCYNFCGNCEQEYSNCICTVYCNGCGCSCCAGINCTDCNGCGCCSSNSHSDSKENNPQPRTEVINGQEIC